ncbi:SDR family NAD(P)-dependent oxidoreductase [Pseudofrankia sp. BMG5.37]|uniref:SDR family NAD(P)-dependent oxidoreductase n=1 Tax=Pseudofrankia sp. BMG5.37 TaxID=3050035 RepID=UPI0009F5F608
MPAKWAWSAGRRSTSSTTTSGSAGNATLEEITPGGISRVVAINLQGMVLTCKHVVPVTRWQGAGVITDISSNAVLVDYPYAGYQTSKAGIVTFTPHLTIANAPTASAPTSSSWFSWTRPWRSNTRSAWRLGRRVIPSVAGVGADAGVFGALGPEPEVG